MKDYLNKQVEIQNTNGSRYQGKLVGFRNQENEFCLSGLVIINRFGGITCPKHKNTRWFSRDKFTINEIKE